MPDVERRAAILAAIATATTMVCVDSALAQRRSRSLGIRPLRGETVSRVRRAAVELATRAQIRDSVILTEKIVLGGYNEENDWGRGAVYSCIGAKGDGPGAIQDKTGAWFNLILGKTIEA